MRFFSLLLRWLCVAPGIAFSLAQAAPGAGIPAWTLEASSTISVPFAGRGGDNHSTLSVEHRWPLGDAGWSFGLGPAAERFTFAAERTDRPRRLESVAALLAVEYFRDGESVAGVVARPGRYVADHASGSGWDVPVDAIASFPLTGAWYGAVGVSTARFYRRPLPIGGIIWEPRQDVRVEAVFPEPAVTWKFARATLRIGGELVGGGFHRDPATPGGRSVEYFTYRVGASVGFETRGMKLTCGAGAEPERHFEFASGRQDLRERSALFVSFGIEFLR